jgi:polyhydroxyalkanoate synthesis regulator phasin
MSINDIVHKALMVGIGVPEKLKDLVDELVQKGELSESQGAKLVKECSEKVTKSGEDISRSITEIVDKTLEKMNIPTRDEVEKLNRKVTTLAARIKKLEEASSSEE